MSRDIRNLGAVIAAAIRAYGEGSERSLQSAAGKIGMSDLGFCRNKVALMTREIPQSDSRPIHAAQVGIAMHDYNKAALKQFFPEWIIEDRKVTATFPSGAQVSGTPDIIAPPWNAVVDEKTVDGYQKVKRYGPSLNNIYQRHAQALACIQEGILDGSKTVYVGNLFFDRSGEEDEPWWDWSEFDPALTVEVDEWITDAIYAVARGQDAMRDVAAPVCEKICEYFTTCRGGLPVNDGQALFDDDESRKMVRMYVEGREMEKTGEKMKKEAGQFLRGMSGTDGEYQVRSTVINSSSNGVDRDPYTRLDVVKVKQPKGSPATTG